MQKEFAGVNEKLDEKASAVDMQKVLNMLDELAKRQEVTEDEKLVMGHQLDRLNR
jgi:hypothetical protein